MSALADLPLTDLRSTALQALSNGRDIEWATNQLRRWLTGRNFAEITTENRVVITELGRLAHQVDSDHQLALGNRVLGYSPIAGGGRRYGTYGRCRCGWRTENNETPAKGGNRQAKDRHREHVAEVATAALGAGKGAS